MGEEGPTHEFCVIVDFGRQQVQGVFNSNLKEAFAEFHPNKATMVYRTSPNKPGASFQGLAGIFFSNKDDAKKAAQEMNDAELEGLRIRCRVASPNDMHWFGKSGKRNNNNHNNNNNNNNQNNHNNNNNSNNFYNNKRQRTSDGFDYLNEMSKLSAQQDNLQINAQQQQQQQQLSPPLPQQPRPNLLPAPINYNNVGNSLNAFNNAVNNNTMNNFNNNNMNAFNNMNNFNNGNNIINPFANNNLPNFLLSGNNMNNILNNLSNLSNNLNNNKILQQQQQQQLQQQQTQRQYENPTSYVNPLLHRHFANIPRTDLKNVILTHPFYIIGATSMCGSYAFPRELAIIEFSFSPSKQHEFHTLIDPGLIPDNLISEANFHTKQVTGIHLHEKATKDFPSLVNSIRQFTNSPIKPIILAKGPRFIYQCLEFLADGARVNITTEDEGMNSWQVNVKPVEEIIELLYYAWDVPLCLSVAGDDFINHNIPPETKCEHHKNKPEKCALGDVKKISQILREVWGRKCK